MIASIPTNYKGINFRSRLEAKWAVFFDLNKISWEYEPTDFNGWIPDFRIRYTYDPMQNPRRITVYVEIKPIQEPCQITIEKITSRASPSSKTEHEALWLLGDSPVCGPCPIGVRMGWSVSSHPPIKDVCAMLNVWNGSVIFGEFIPGLNQYVKSTTRLDEVSLGSGFDLMSRWHQACNKTQWRKPT